MNKARPDFQGANAAYLLELHDRYRRDPRSVDPETRAYFDRWEPGESSIDALTATARDGGGAQPADLRKVVGAVNLAQAIRAFGHLPAQLDPLGTPPPNDPALDLAFHGLTDADLAALPASLIGGAAAQGKANALEAIAELRRIYSTHTGHDFDHVTNPEEREWLREAVEAGHFRPPLDPVDEIELLDRLTQVEVFERFLHRVFPG